MTFSIDSAKKIEPIHSEIVELSISIQKMFLQDDYWYKKGAKTVLKKVRSSSNFVPSDLYVKNRQRNMFISF